MTAMSPTARRRHRDQAQEVNGTRRLAIKIDWAALVLVVGVSITITVVFVVLLAFGIRLVSAANVRIRDGQAGAGSLEAGYALLGLAGVLVLLGLYLIVSQFH